jgi:hypothetical protein
MGTDHFVWGIRKPRMSFVDHESAREEKTPKLFSELAVKFWRERPDRRIGTLDPLVSILGKSTFLFGKVTVSYASLTRTRKRARKSISFRITD